MKYSKTHVNEIVDQVLEAMKKTELGIENNHKFIKEFELIKEEHLLVDRRYSHLDAYETEIVNDFMRNFLSYKELMAKYHCSFRKLRSLLFRCAENDDRIYDEIELRRKT